MTEFTHQGQHPARECIAEKELSRCNEFKGTIKILSCTYPFQIPDVPNSSKIFAYYIYARLQATIAKVCPRCYRSPILYKPQLGHRNQASNSNYSFSPLWNNGKMPDLSNFIQTYFIDASILPDISWHCAIANVICVASRKSSACANWLLKELHWMNGGSPLDRLVDSARIFCLVISTSRSKVEGWDSRRRCEWILNNRRHERTWDNSVWYLTLDVLCRFRE